MSEFDGEDASNFGCGVLAGCLLFPALVFVALAILGAWLGPQLR